MTKGQAEAKISEAVSKFEIEYMGRGPKQIRTQIIQDLIIIRLKGFLSQSEQKLAGIVMEWSCSKRFAPYYLRNLASI